MSSDDASPVSLRRRLGAVVLRVLRSVLLAFLLVILAMTFLERWLVYPSPPLSAGNWSPSHLEYEEAEFQATDGVKLHGWFFEHPQPERVAIYLHGNGEDVSLAANLMPLVVRKLKASVLVFDYRGYGRSHGKPYEQGVIMDGLAASAWLAERTGRPVEEHVLIGRSLGGGVAVAMAERQGAGCLVLQNTFTRLTDVAAHLYPWAPVSLCMRNRYPSIDRIRGYDGPVYSVHGTSDNLAPFKQGKELYLAAPTTNKRFVALEGFSHNDSLPKSHWDELARFLDEL